MLNFRLSVLIVLLTSQKFINLGARRVSFYGISLNLSLILHFFQKLVIVELRYLGFVLFVNDFLNGTVFGTLFWGIFFGLRERNREFVKILKVVRILGIV